MRITTRIWIIGINMLAMCIIVGAQTYPQIRLDQQVLSRKEILEVRCYESQSDSLHPNGESYLTERIVLNHTKRKITTLRYNIGDSISAYDSTCMGTEAYFNSLKISPDKRIKYDSAHHIVEVVTIMRSDTTIDHHTYDSNGILIKSTMGNVRSERIELYYEYYSNGLPARIVNKTYRPGFESPFVKTYTYVYKYK